MYCPQGFPVCGGECQAHAEPYLREKPVSAAHHSDSPQRDPVEAAVPAYGHRGGARATRLRGPEAAQGGESHTPGEAQGG